MLGEHAGDSSGRSRKGQRFSDSRQPRVLVLIKPPGDLTELGLVCETVVCDTTIPFVRLARWCGVWERVLSRACRSGARGRSMGQLLRCLISFLCFSVAVSVSVSLRTLTTSTPRRLDLSFSPLFLKPCHRRLVGNPGHPVPEEKPGRPVQSRGRPPSRHRASPFAAGTQRSRHSRRFRR